MLEDLRNEMHNFIHDIAKNIKNKEDLLYMQERTSKLFDVIMDELDKIINYKEDRINAIIKKQELEDVKLQELKEKIENVCEDIYEDQDEDFLINCPYCGTEFDAEIDEEYTEIRCPECENIIELDWNGNPEDEQDSGCGGNCSHCKGCEE